MPTFRDEKEPCKKCGGKRKRSPKGCVYCADCNKRYREENRDRNRVRDRQYYRDHLDQCKSTMAKYREENRESILAYERSEERRNRTKEWQTEGNTGSRHPDYPVWVSAKSRCFNPNAPKYKTHGQRGVTMCASWRESFEQFIQDVGERPEPRHLYSLDRYPDRNGNYEPGNVRWATAKEQSLNTRRQLDYRLGIPESSNILYYGQIMTLKEFSKYTGLPLVVVKYRYAMNPDSNYILQWGESNRKYFHEGHYYSSTELSLITGLPVGKVMNRMRNLGWTVKQLLERK